MEPSVLDVPEAETVDDLLDSLVSLQRSKARLAALESSLLVRMAGAVAQEREVTVLDRATDEERTLVILDEMREEIAAALHRSPSAVHDQISDARLLFGPLTATRDALAAGRITESHVRVVCEQARRMQRSQPEDAEWFATACADLQARVLPRAEGLTPGQTRSLARRVVAAIDADGERRRRSQARRTADVVVCTEDDGMALLMAWLPEVDALRIGALVDGYARLADLPVGCAASIGERRAAALVALLDGAGERLPGVEVAVTVSLEELIDPQGPLSALLDDPSVPVTLRRLVTDPQTGCARDLGRTRYRVSDDLRRWITARDRACAFPGCGRAAHRCDIDHVEAWEDGGRTDAANLQPLCRRHHQAKTHGGWSVRQDPGGERTWLSPRGRIHHQHPPPVTAPLT